MQKSCQLGTLDGLAINDDIVDRLRYYIPGRQQDCEEAAAEIERLCAHVEWLTKRVERVPAYLCTPSKN